MSAEFEIKLLTEMLADRDNAAASGAAECPAPAILWALVEHARETEWTASLRQHVAGCTACAQLVRSLQGFAEAAQSQPASQQQKEVWASAKPRLSGRVWRFLESRTRWKRSPSWSVAWLLPGRLNPAWALTGVALIVVAAAVLIGHYGFERSQDEALRAMASRAGHASPPAGSPSDAELPPPARGQTELAQKSTAETASLLLAAGSRARAAILFVQRDADGGSTVQGELTPLSPAGFPLEQTASFSARWAAGTGIVRLDVRAFTLKDRRYELAGRNAASVMVSWPETDQAPAAGQAFEIRIVSGALLQGSRPE